MFPKEILIMRVFYIFFVFAFQVHCFETRTEDIEITLNMARQNIHALFARKLTKEDKI